jgi:predicted P-loop ATPase
MATPGEADWKTKLIRSKAGPKPLLANAITALRLHPAWIGVLSYDEFALRVVLDKAPPWYKSMAPWTPRVWVEHDDLSCTNWLQHRDIGVSVGIAAQAVEAVAHARKFHPVRDYLDGLKHDGERRIDTWLVEFLGVEDTPYTRAVGQAMLIAAIARIRDPGCKVDNVPILESDQQGKLKSTSIKAMFDPWFSDELADLGSKDAAMQTCGVWGIEMAELDSMSKSEVSKAKAFITRTTDRFRPPYGRRLIESKRSCVFWGTTNQDEYLRDETGGRRFWPLQVGDLTLEELRAARDQLWAEADVMYAAGTKWWLTDANVLAGAETEQLSRQVSEAWDEPIGKYVAQHVGSSALITPLQVLSEGLFLTEISKIGQPEVNRVVRSLKRLGFKRVRRLNEATGKREYFYQRRIPTGGAEIIPLAGRRPALDSATRRMIEGADEIAAAKARGSNF